MTIDRIRRNRS